MHASRKLHAGAQPIHARDVSSRPQRDTERHIFPPGCSVLENNELGSAGEPPDATAWFALARVKTQSLEKQIRNRCAKMFPSEHLRKQRTGLLPYFSEVICTSSSQDRANHLSRISHQTGQHASSPWSPVLGSSFVTPTPSGTTPAARQAPHYHQLASLLLPSRSGHPTSHTFTREQEEVSRETGSFGDQQAVLWGQTSSLQLISSRKHLRASSPS